MDMSLKLKWLLLGILLFILLEIGTSRTIIEDEEEFSLLKIQSPSSHVALSGDLEIFVGRVNETFDDETEYKYEFREDDNDESNLLEIKESYSLLLRVMYLQDDISELIGEIPLQGLPTTNETVSILIPCKYFSRGGIYILKVECEHDNSTMFDASRYQMKTSKVLDVKWPQPTITMESIDFTTYPNKPIRVTIKYTGVKCNPPKNIPSTVYTLQLIYCGSIVTACYLQNNTHIQVLHKEELRNFSLAKTVSFQCELFGLPGNYAARLTPSNPNLTAPSSSIYFKVNWSEEFRLTVHAKSIYPCEGSGGVPVLFEYPSCRLGGDRIRVFGRLKADVTSIASPSTLHYITESRSIPGKHSLTFDCDLFTEKFVEYCFIYVSQAVTGAMADVKMSCVPTFPFQEGDAASWGPWSPWSACSSSCFGGIRNRYRFCDAPPPKYGAKFCQGKAIETELCGKIFWQESDRNEWHNQVENSDCRSAILVATKPEVLAEIGRQCRCGCRILLREQPYRKILGANTQACPGRSFWLLQAPKNFVIGLHLNQLQFPCPGQYFRVRDGNSLNADLLIDITFGKVTQATKSLLSTGQNLLVEFFSDELTASGAACIGGFLAHAALLDEKYLKRNETVTIVPFVTNSTSIEKEWIFWKPAHLATAMLLIVMFIVSILLTLQFFIKHRKYRIAENMDSFSDVSELMAGSAKFLSTSTIISEVISIIETVTKTPLNQVLTNQEERYNSTETLTGFKDESTLSSSTLKLRNVMESSSEDTVMSVKSNCDKLLSSASILVYNKPKVKYAYPVKLQTMDCDIEEEQVSSTHSEKIDDTRDCTISKVCDSNSFNHSQRKMQEYSPESVVSSSSTLGSGKETKERRNREKLLQGPGSEFSLTNPDSELELDYYDYNVENASAVPGSYLGMDPAFLVWIPPIDHVKLDTEDLLLSSSKRSSILALETEGTSLTPSEYRRMKLSNYEDFGLERTRTFEKLLPVKKLLDDSSIKVSMESVSSMFEQRQHSDIPNRKVFTCKDEESSEESNSSKSLLGSPTNVLTKGKSNSEKSNTSQNKTLQRDLDKLKHHSNKFSKDQDADETMVPLKYKELMMCTQSFANMKDTVNIPMRELSGIPIKDFAQVEKLCNKEVEASFAIQNPDYGIEAFCARQGAFYDQKIKYVDDDEEEYMD